MTLVFLGDQNREAVPDLVAALDQVGQEIGPVRVKLGQATAVLNHRVLVVPVSGLDALAAAVLRQVRPWLPNDAQRSFNAHLTLARTRGRARLPRAAGGEPVRQQWVATGFVLMRSLLESNGSAYSTEATFALGG